MKSPDEVLADMRAAETGESGDDLPPITTIDIDVVDGRGKRHQGRFVFKVPTLADQIMVGRLKAQYLPAGAAADANAALLVEQICYLEVTLQFSASHPRPDWWQPFQLYDATPVSALYAEVMAYEAKFHGSNTHAGAAENGAEPVANESESAGEASAAPVGRKVQPTAQRRETLVSHTPRGD